MKREYRNSARTKKMIREAFAELMSERRGIANISVSELAERADIAKSTFYNHYDDIYSVADEMIGEIEQGLNLFIDAIEADSNANYKIYLKNIFAFLRLNEDLYRRLLGSPDAQMFIGKIKYIITKRVISGRLFPMMSTNDTSGELKIRFLINGCVDTVVEYLRGDVNMPFDDMVNSLLGYIDKIIG